MCGHWQLSTRGSNYSGSKSLHSVSSSSFFFFFFLVTIKTTASKFNLPAAAAAAQSVQQKWLIYFTSLCVCFTVPSLFSVLFAVHFFSPLPYNRLTKFLTVARPVDFLLLLVCWFVGLQTKQNNKQDDHWNGKTAAVANQRRGRRGRRRSSLV